MTTIDPRTLKKGDRIRYSRVVTVERDGTVPSRYGKERIYTRTESGGMCQPIVDDLEIELLERPLPDEPPIGSIVIFHNAFGSLDACTAYQRFGSWWQTTRAGGPGRYSWADVLTFHPEANFERIEIGARS